MNYKLNFKELISVALLIFFGLFVNNIQAQNVCYAVAEDNGAPNYLFVYDEASNSWTNVGITGTDNVEALAIDDATATVYVTDNGTLGTIDPNTAAFTIIGTAGTGNGSVGAVVIDDIDGLTYDPTNGILWGSHRVGGSGPGTNDLLVQIDPATGALIAGAFGGDDYVVIEEVFDGSLATEVYDVDDIALNTASGDLYAIQNDDGPGVLTIISTIDGTVSQIVYDMPDDDIEGLGFTEDGVLFATTGNNGDEGVADPNSFLIIDYTDQSTTVVGLMDPAGVGLDFEALDCFTIPCDADAGTITADAGIYTLSGADVEICATADGNSVVPAGYATLYVLTSGDDLVIQDASASNCFMVDAIGEYTIHTLVYDANTLDLSIIEFGTTTGVDVLGLTQAGGGTICASLDAAGASISVVPEPCTADAGTITADAGSYTLAGADVEICATGNGDNVIPAGYSSIYVLTTGTDLVILDAGGSNCFIVDAIGNYTIHTLVYDPNTLDLTVVEFGTTTGGDIFGLTEAGGGTICASLDAAGASISVVDVVCDADCGTLTANTSDPIDITNGPGSLNATPDGNAFVPAGYSTIYVLTSGDDLVIEDTNTAPSFIVTNPGTYTIHCLIYDPVTLDLSTVQTGVTTGFDVNSLLIQGGGFICASLDVAGAAFTVTEQPPVGTDFVCYAVSDNGIEGLMEYNGDLNQWTKIGPTGALAIEAIAIDGENAIIYAEDGGNLGTLDPNTGTFTLIGSAGTANGAIGAIVLNDLDGLTYDYTNDILWASHRIDSDVDNDDIQEIGTNDILVQIDPATGAFIAGAFAGDDYVVIEEAFDGTLNAEVYDVDDIALDPSTGRLYAVQNFDGPGLISEISPIDGSIISIVYDTPDDDLEGLGFNANGDLYATSGNNGSTGSQNSFIFIDIVNEGSTVIGVIDQDNTYSDFEGFDCFNFETIIPPVCLADAGSITADASNVTLDAATVEICATPDGNAVVPAGYTTLYVLTSGSNLIIEQASPSSCFNVDATGTYTIHTLVYNPTTLDLSVVEFGVTPAADVLGLVIANDICASLDVAGAQIIVEAPLCNADCGTITAVQNTYGLEAATVEICATPDANAFVPVGYSNVFVLTSGSDYIMQDAGASSCFEVDATGDYTIHCLIYDPNTLDLQQVIPGVTTAAEVNSWLIQGGGTICASLDLVGAPITVAAIVAVPNYDTTSVDMPIAVAMLDNDIYTGDVAVIDVTAPLDVDGNPSGSVAFNSDSTAFIFTPAPGATGTFCWNYTIQDATTLTDETEVCIFIPEPVILANPNYDTTAVDMPIEVAVLGNDVYTGEAVITAFTQSTDAAGNPSGSVAYNADSTGFVFTPAPGATGTFCWNYTIQDATTLTDDTEVCIYIPEAATIDAVADYDTTLVNTPIDINPLVNDSDNATIKSFEDVATDVDGNASGTVTLNGDVFTFEPALNATGNFCWNYCVQDVADANLVDTATVCVYIPTPAILALPDYDSTAINTPIDIAALNNDSDSTTIKSYEEFATDANGNPSGTVSLSGNIFTFDPALDATGNFCWNYCIQDISDSTLVDTTTVCIYIPTPSGCEDLKANLVSLKDNNLLTPNNDTYNDDWTVPALGDCCPDADLIIFNRWGNMVHKVQLDELENGHSWDGSWDEDLDGFQLSAGNGLFVPTGTYFWCLVCDNNDAEKLSGFIEVINPMD